MVPGINEITCQTKNDYRKKKTAREQAPEAKGKDHCQEIKRNARPRHALNEHFIKKNKSHHERKKGRKVQQKPAGCKVLPLVQAEKDDQ
jgi:hypothetical protein